MVPNSSNQTIQTHVHDWKNNNFFTTAYASAAITTVAMTSITTTTACIVYLEVQNDQREAEKRFLLT